ncbi:MAG: hypothetical protein QGH83_03045 [Candidatus Pacebacteria bacterium]|jgi:hypothetical protein|nr:hypothetical protein [Candidatus Paceibacterota bacterium]|tara:strand:- start:772 stop:933 length:162 start_codon:yes stop_codon:yes gene_type:complete
MTIWTKINAWLSGCSESAEEKTQKTTIEVKTKKKTSPKKSKSTTTKKRKKAKK